MIGLTLVSALAALASGVMLTRSLTRQIGTTIQQLQSSSAELQAAANQQATGASEQAAAMSEVSTTIKELLSTSRQIAQSAQRVARIAEDTAERMRVEHPGLTVFAETVETSPARGMVAEAEGARLLVIGTHDRRGVQRVMLGSVGHDVLLNALTPVAVVRNRAQRRDRTAGR